MDALDGIDIVIRERLRIARVLRSAGALVDDGRARLTTRAIKLVHELLIEMMRPEATPPVGATSKPVSDQPPLPPQQ